MARKKRKEIDQDAAPMTEWIKWRTGAMDGEEKRLALALTMDDWVAVRCLIEEFPEDGLPPSEVARRELIVQRYHRANVGDIGSFGVAYARPITYALQLEALREDRERFPDLYDGDGFEEMRDVPWRRELLDSGQVKRRGGQDWTDWTSPD